MGGFRPYGPPSYLNCGFPFNLYNQRVTLNLSNDHECDYVSFSLLGKGRYTLIHIKAPDNSMNIIHSILLPRVT